MAPARRSVFWVVLGLMVGSMPSGGQAAVASTLAKPSGGCGPTWTIEPSPSPGNAGNSLNSVTAIDASDAWSVGSYNVRSPGLTTKALILHWDGVTWTQVPSTAPDNTFLRSVSAVSDNDVWVVGYPPHAEHWDGTTWSAVPLPDPGGIGFPTLNSVDGSTSTDVWAVGFWEPRLEWWQPFIMHWDGAAWEVVPSPSIGIQSYLHGVAANSPTDAWAVGWGIDTSHRGRSFALHWDGVDWTLVRTWNPRRGADGYLRAVTAESGVPRAAGYAYATDGLRAKSVIQRWDGLAWERELIVDESPGRNLLYGIADTPSGEAWAVGEADATQSRTETLIQHWDGVKWAIQESPNGPVGDTALSGVAASADEDVWAVGYSTLANGVTQTLTEHLCP